MSTSSRFSPSWTARVSSLVAVFRRDIVLSADDGRRQCEIDGEFDSWRRNIDSLRQSLLRSLPEDINVLTKRELISLFRFTN